MRKIFNRIRYKLKKFDVRKTSKFINLSHLILDLKHLGIQTGDTVMLHSSLSKIGYVDGGPRTLIRAILKVIGKNGTLVIPTYTMKGNMYNTCIDKKYTFNLKKPTKLGAVPSEFLRVDGIYRSIHPTHSVSAIGKNANYIIKDHHIGERAFGENSPWGKIIELKGKFLGIGVSLGPTTQYHYVEDIMEGDFPIRVKLDKIYKIKCKINKNEVIYVKVNPHDPNVAKTRIDKRESYFIRDFFWDIFKNLGILHIGKIGEAKSWWIDAKIFIEILKKLAKLGITIYSTEDQVKSNNLYPVDLVIDKIKST